MKQSSLNGNGNGTRISEHNSCNEETANIQSYTYYIELLFPMMGVYIGMQLDEIHILQCNTI